MYLVLKPYADMSSLNIQFYIEDLIAKTIVTTVEIRRKYRQYSLYLVW